MKRIYTILVAVLITATVWAQAPEKMSYQAVIRDTSSQLVTSTSVGMQISILQGSATGTAVYVETQNPTTNANGLVTIEIGTGTVVSGDFATIDWANDTYFIKTETDLNGGSNYTITGTSQLLSVPYALHAKTAESITGGSSGYYVGELIGTNGEDGVVFYVDETGQHGLICSKTDIDGGSGVVWSNIDNVEIGATAQSQFNGVTNTAAIIGQSGHTSSAAKLCADYSTTNTSAGDWYLPSIDELSKIYHAKYEINKALNVNSFALTYYWSSTELTSSYAWDYSFIYGYSNYFTKDNPYSVRAVRAF